MNFVDLTMPLNHRWMPDEGLPTAIKFFLGPKDHQEKGMVVGSDSGTSLAPASAVRRVSQDDTVRPGARRKIVLTADCGGTHQ